MSECIIKAGRIIQQSRNLAGIRRYVGTHLIQRLSITEYQDRSAQLYIEFEDGASFRSAFCSAAVLREFVRRWRNVYGATLWMNDRDAGKITWDNPNLFNPEMNRKS